MSSQMPPTVAFRNCLSIFSFTEIMTVQPAGDVSISDFKFDIGNSKT